MDSDSSGKRCGTPRRSGDLDRARHPVVRVVEVGARRRSGADVGGDRLGLAGREDHDEVVAADVADEGLGVAEVPDLPQQVGERPDGLVAAQEAVVVVERLELVEVDVQQRERQRA
jgi:hypothetical protein